MATKRVAILRAVVVGVLLLGGDALSRTQTAGYHGPWYQNVAIDVMSGEPDYSGVAAWTRSDGHQYYSSDCSNESRAAE